METTLHPVRRCRPATRVHWQRAVTRVIEAMIGHLSDAMSTKSLAEIAYISPYHFNRVFRQVTSIPPCHYLAALRLDTARRLLLTTAHSVTDICLDVGYSSLGTFTARFRRAFGVSPRELRRLARRDGSALARAVRRLGETPEATASGTRLSGRVMTTGDLRGPICVGAFPTPVPEGVPVACTFVSAPGDYALANVPSGRYYLLAAALAGGNDDELDLTNATLMQGRAEPGPAVVDGGSVSGATDILLRRPEVTDPPLLAVLPILVAAHHDRTSRQP